MLQRRIVCFEKNQYYSNAESFARGEKDFNGFVSRPREKSVFLDINRNHSQSRLSRDNQQQPLQCEYPRPSGQQKIWLFGALH